MKLIWLVDGLVQSLSIQQMWILLLVVMNESIGIGLATVSCYSNPEFQVLVEESFKDSGRRLAESGFTKVGGGVHN